jgi:hypothetical protein
MDFCGALARCAMRLGLFRLYAPLEPWFNKTWKPDDFELVNSLIARRMRRYGRTPRKSRFAGRNIPPVSNEAPPQTDEAWVRVCRWSPVSSV